MSLFQRPLQPPAILSDQAVERYLEAVRAEVSVDPLFRRRLRGTVVNQFVAEREGRSSAAAGRRMGGLGRTVLYATVILSVSVSSAMAASQGALPGDGLYPLKLQIERLRFEALPAHLHDDLAAYALGERIHELGRLAERGDWEAVARQSTRVEAQYVSYARAIEGNRGTARPQLVVLDALLNRLPIRAQVAVSGVLAGVATAHGEAVKDPGNGPGGGSATGASGRDGRPVASGEMNRRTPEPAANPNREPTRDAMDDAGAQPTPKATKSPRAQPRPNSPSSSGDDANGGD